MATKNKGPWSDAARAKRIATMEAKKSNLGPVQSVAIDPNEPEPKPAKRPYTKQAKAQPKVKAVYDKATIRACIDRLMEML